jgi:DNA repair protein RadC
MTALEDLTATRHTTDVIRDLPADERPRERLLAHGAATLSDAELLAILLGSGMRGCNAIQLARILLRDGMATLVEQDAGVIARQRGVGSAKGARIAAAFEISRRLASRAPGPFPRFEAEEFGAVLVRTVAHQKQERLGAAFLDSRNGIRRQREIFVGTVNSAMVSTRDIVRYALEENAVGVVLYHNHPSGNAQPSAEDVVFTRKAREALKLVDIDLADHLVIGAQTFWSMRMKGQV